MTGPLFCLPGRAVWRRRTVATGETPSAEWLSPLPAAALLSSQLSSRLLAITTRHPVFGTELSAPCLSHRDLTIFPSSPSSHHLAFTAHRSEPISQLSLGAGKLRPSSAYHLEVVPRESVSSAARQPRGSGLRRRAVRSYRAGCWEAARRHPPAADAADAAGFHTGLATTAHYPASQISRRSQAN